ncbi:hypothetical protein BD626DRAFT_485210 [Schizophyllum amplum]|uniref:ZZ-type domain-containing protein n=1 Tax=Schizophyllum amplum TaxID=97359 RepID=A0A550CR02_9AGAR|nr:hypothetical protein BD626DRAFT_485210 [Auriculariopsis ampla]
MSTNSEASGSTTQLKRGTIIMEDTGVKVFRVEDTFFTVHTHFLIVHSLVFRDMLLVAQANEGEGASEENPIVLDGIHACDFDLLLRIIYTPCTLTEASPLYTATAEECIGLMTLMDRWQMDDLLTMVRRAMQERKWDAVDKIVLAQGAEMDAAWTSAAYHELVMRTAPPTPADGKRMGWETYGLVRDVREVVANLPSMLRHFLACQRLQECLPAFISPPLPQDFANELHGANCDECGTVIVGPRYKCMHPQCPDYDHCSACEAVANSHPKDHPLLKIKEPVFRVRDVRLEGFPFTEL